jgi:hypothetical protein
VLVLEQKGATGPRRGGCRAEADARLVGVGPQGAVFLTGREAPKGVLSGAPASLFPLVRLVRAHGDGFAAEPAAAPVADVVTATETVMAALRRGDKDEARSSPHLPK